MLRMGCMFFSRFGFWLAVKVFLSQQEIFFFFFFLSGSEARLLFSVWERQNCIQFSFSGLEKGSIFFFLLERENSSSTIHSGFLFSLLSKSQSCFSWAAKRENHKHHESAFKRSEFCFSLTDCSSTQYVSKRHNAWALLLQTVSERRQESFGERAQASLFLRQGLFFFFLF